MTLVKICDIADMQGGVYVRSRKGKDVALLNANDFDEAGDLRLMPIPTLASIDCPKQHLLQDNDILLVTKGSRFFSAVYKSTFGLCIASTAFIVLRVKTPSLIPQYLSLLMNEALQSAYFKNRIRGTALLSIQKDDIAEYRLSLPPIKKQQTIIALSHEYKKQIQIYQSLVEKKQTLMHSLILS